MKYVRICLSYTKIYGIHTYVCVYDLYIYIYVCDMCMYIYTYDIYYLYDYMYIHYIYICVLWLDMANWSEKISSFEPRHRSSSCRASTAMARCLSGRPSWLKAVLGWNGYGMTDSMDWFTLWLCQNSYGKWPFIVDFSHEKWWIYSMAISGT